MVLWPSSSFTDNPGRHQNSRVDLSSKVAFETADDVALVHSIRSSTVNVRLGPRIMTQPDDDYSIECRVGPTVSTAIQTIAVGFSGRRGDRVNAAQGDESSLGMEAIRVAAVAGPTPEVLTRKGATDRVSRPISNPSSRSSSLSRRKQRASERSVY